MNTTTSILIIAMTQAQFNGVIVGTLVGTLVGAGVGHVIGSLLYGTGESIFLTFKRVDKFVRILSERRAKILAADMVPVRTFFQKLEIGVMGFVLGRLVLFRESLLKRLGPLVQVPLEPVSQPDSEKSAKGPGQK